MSRGRSLVGGVVVAAFAAGCAAEPAPELTPEPPVLRRLTQHQYENAVRDLFGDDIVVPGELEPETRVAGLEALGVATAAISPRGVERYEKAAFLVAEQAVTPERRESWTTCAPSLDDDVCFETVLGAVGRRAWRRPLTAEELSTAVELASQAADTLDDPWEGLSFGVAFLLQAPEFLLRVELGEKRGDTRAYTGFEMAARLSFLLWNSLPDDELLDAAAAGELDTVEGLEAQTLRMIGSPRASSGLRAFATDYLHLGELDSVLKDPRTFVHMSQALPGAAREETLRLFDRVVLTEDAPMFELLRTRETEVDPTLAALYDVRAPDREGFGPVTYPEDQPRAGLLGQASFLMLHAHPTTSSPTHRGMFVRESMVCGTIPPPPANVDTSIPEPSPDAPTMRDRIKAHLEVEACANCHLSFDPLGLAFESFDGVGRYRTEENGAPLDLTGDFDGVAFDGPLSFVDALEQHPDFVPCMVSQVSRYALGRVEADAEAESLAWLTSRFEAQDHRVSALWVDLVTSPLFRYVGEVE
jgi:hypothetical protein